MRIYNLAGTLIKTIVSNGVEAGQGSELWNTDLPAAAGIYTYTIHATHSEDPPMPVICADADKSQVLEIGDVDLDWFTYDARALTLAGEIRYTLNRSAGSAQLSVFHPDLTLVQAWEVPSVTGTSAFEFQFPVLADPATPYWFVLEAIEADAEAQENRDELAKPALQKGGWRVLPLRAYSFRGALFPSASAAIDWASQQQGHPQEGEFYPHPSYTPAEHLLNWDVKSSYERLADHDVNWNHNPVADGAVFYIGHGEPGVMLVGDEYANGRKEIWTGQGSDADFLGCFYMGNPRFGASALRRANVVVVAACWSADDREPGAPNGPRASVMDEFTNRGAGAAIGYHGLLSEAVATAFCDHFWLVASKQCEVRYEGGEQVHVPRETSIQLAFDEARQISGTPTRWECVGSAAADRLRPAAYGGDGP
ncbi:MAG: hypothetical protein GF393_05505 [Armatimonadia bacterium]|nr:hypothetical protein [Armatimonadia bacterium]